MMIKNQFHNLHLENQKIKHLFFLVGLPRSGNTLFASIMNQNSNIAVTANSIVLEIISNLSSLKETILFKNYPDYKSLNNVLDIVFDQYYKDWPQQFIIDRSPVMTPGNFMLMQKHFKRSFKCIIILRDVLDVLASYVKWFEKEPTSFVNKYDKKTIEEKLWMLMNKDGAIARQLESIKNSYNYPEICHYLKYDDLINNTEVEINKIYDFLQIPKFNHNFKSLKQFQINGISYDDTVVGNRMHIIREEIRKEENPYKSQLPKSIIDAYGHIKF